MANEFEFSFENAEAFRQALDRLGQVTSDFRIPFRLVASDFYRSQKQLFKLQSAGLYNPLGGFNYNAPSGYGNQTKRDRAEALKEKRTGRPWNPILYGETGNLKNSTLSPSHKYSIFFVGRQEMQLGTSVPYGEFHQSDEPRSVIPFRKFVFIDGGPADRSKGSGLSGRRERWISIFDDHLKQLISGRVL